MVNNTIQISTEEYRRLIGLEMKIEAVGAYYNSTDYPNEDTMAAMLGITKKAKQELQISQFMAEKKED